MLDFALRLKTYYFNLIRVLAAYVEERQGTLVGQSLPTLGKVSRRVSRFSVTVAINSDQLLFLVSL